MKNLKLWSVAVAVALLLGGTTSVSQADTILSLYNTGVDANGVPLPNGSVDPHYTVTPVNPDGSTQVLTTGFPIGPWTDIGFAADPNNVSEWISPEQNGGGDDPQNTTYYFTTTFDMTGYDLTTASIAGVWSSDNDGVSILLNSNDTGNSATSFTQFQSGAVSFSIGSGFFVAGLNTLTFVVNNGAGTSGNPAGLRVEMVGTAAGVPLPGSLALLLAGVPGLTGVGWYLRRQQPKNAEKV